MKDFVQHLVTPQRLTEVVDIGANPIDGTPPYQPMLQAGLCRVTGFEPQPKAFNFLQTQKTPNERYMPYAIGDGHSHTLHVYRASGMSSLLEIDPVVFEVFNALKPFAKLKEHIPTQTKKLDDIHDIEHLDFLKLDIQGTELAALQGGIQKLSQAVVIQSEISFITLYKHQPSFGDIDLEMRRQGFIPHCFSNIKHWPISPCVIDNNPRRPLNQLIEADIVYVRDFFHSDAMSDEQLKHLALIMHHCYQSFDLALRCIMLLEQRHTLKSDAQKQYRQFLKDSLLLP